MKFKKGYLIIVESSENDGDNYCREQLGFSDKELMLEEVKVLSSYKKTYSINNLFEPNKLEEEAVINWVRSHYDFFSPIEKDLSGEELLDTFFAWAADYSLAGSEFFTRELEKIEVLQVPEDVEFKTIKLTDLGILND